MFGDINVLHKRIKLSIRIDNQINDLKIIKWVDGYLPFSDGTNHHLLSS